MTARDVLISRVHDSLGLPMNSSARGRGEELWAVTAKGQTSLTVHPFTEALEVALTWAVESAANLPPHHLI